MSETRTATRKLTYNDGLPLGTRATFKENGETWIALPLTKYIANLTICDRLIGTLEATRIETTQWLTTHPDDAERVIMLLNIIARSHTAATTAAAEKVAVNAL